MRHFLRRMRPNISVHPALFAFVVWVILFLSYNILSDNHRYLQVNAETEALNYRVARPALATFPVVRAVISNQSQCETVFDGVNLRDFDGLIKPSFQAAVNYRIAQNRVSVRLEAHDSLSSNPEASAGDLIVSGARCSLTDSATIVYSLSDENRRPLPVAGPMEIGVAFGTPLAPERGRRAHEGFMHGAEVLVFGRALWTDRLFPLYDSAIAIPAGGTLSTVEFDRERTSDDDSYEDSTDWYGVVEMGEAVFLVTATVQTTDLVFTRAGSAGEKETIAVGFFTEVARDPDLSASLLWLGLLFFIFQAIELSFSMRQI